MSIDIRKQEPPYGRIGWWWGATTNGGCWYRGGFSFTRRGGLKRAARVERRMVRRGSERTQ